MTFPVETSLTLSDLTASTTPAISMPATANAGDILIMIVGIAGGTPTTSTSPAGWNVIYNPGSTNVVAFWKSAAGTEGGTTVSLTLGNSRATYSGVWRYTGGSTMEFVAVAATSTVTSDPSNLAPSWGSTSIDTSWLVASTRNQRNETLSATPTGYSNTMQIAATIARQFAWGTKDAAIVSDNPSTYTWSNALNDSIAFTIAVKGTSNVVASNGNMLLCF